MGRGKYKPMNENGVQQSDRILSSAASLRAFPAKCNGMYLVKQAEPEDRIGIFKQTIFLVVNNQRLCENQLGSPSFLQKSYSGALTSGAVLKNLERRIYFSLPQYLLASLRFFHLEFKESTSKSPSLFK